MSAVEDAEEKRWKKSASECAEVRGGDGGDGDSKDEDVTQAPCSGTG